MGRITRAEPYFSAEEVKERMRNDPNPLYRERWSIIYTAQVHPREAKEIAKDIGVSVSKVHTLIPRYNNLGVAAVETPGKGGRHHEYMTVEEEKQFLEALLERAKKGELVTIKQIKRAYEQKVGHKINEVTIYRLLKRHRWRKVMPRPYHPKANKQEQEDFKNDFPNKVKEAEKTKDPQDCRPTLIMAQDEGCFGRINRLQRAWAPEHVRPQVPRQIVREYTYVYAAVAPEEGKMTFLILPYTNTEMMNLFLKQVSKDFSSYFIVMQVDQAGWHGSKDLVIPKNIRLIPQPSGSPELNPVEHLWDELREKYFANGYSESLDEVIQILCDGLMQLESDPKSIRSMTYFPHLRIIA
jgi:transposase